MTRTPRRHGGKGDSVFRSGWTLRLSAFLALTGLLSGFIPPNTALAAETQAPQVTLPDKALANRSRVKFPQRGTNRSELTPQRTENVRHFLNPDGSFSAEMTTEPQFYEDPTTHVMRPIENRLKGAVKPGYAYLNGDNRFSTYLTAQANSSAVARLEMDGTAIAFGIDHATPAVGEVKENAITYRGVLPSADVKYEVIGEGLKESIILRNASTPTRFLFPLTLEGLTYKAQPNGSIQLFKDGKPTYEMPVPYMYEQSTKDIMSPAVTQTIKEENGQLFLEIQADSTWLQAPERKFPIVIDPSVIVVGQASNVVDSFISASYPTTNYNYQGFISAGNHPTFGTVRGLMRFDLPSLPDGAVITSAAITYYLDMTVSGTTKIDLYRVNSDWNETSVTWNTQPVKNAAPESSASVGTSNSSYSFDITKLAQDWYGGAQANFGIELLANPEGADRRSFEGGTSSNSAWRPKLTINYTVDPVGDQSWWTYTGAVNPFNGNLMLTSTDLSLSGRGPQLPITRTYNSRNATRKGAFGYGWSSNLEMAIVQLGYGPAIFWDATGTKHVFKRNSDGTFAPPPGIHYSLTRSANGQFTLTTVDRSTYLFNSSGLLLQIADANGQMLTIDRNETDGSLKGFTDASGRKWYVGKNDYGFIDHIESPHEEGRIDYLTAYYMYDRTNGNLTTVTIKQDENLRPTTTYEYNASAHQLTAVVDPNGNRKSLTYTADNRVGSVNWTHVSTSYSETFTYDQSNKKTTVEIPAMGLKTIYSFNDNGNLIKQEVVGDSATYTTSYGWDTWNQMVQVTDPNNNVKYYGYNELGQPVIVQDETGNANLIQTQSATYDQQGNQTGTKDEKGDTAAARYDLGNNLTEQYDQVGNLTLMSYGQAPQANAGNLLSSTNPISLFDNLLINPGFENGTVGWTTTGSPDNTRMSGGSYSLKLPVGANAKSANLPVTPGSYYTLTADIWADTTATFWFNVYWYKGDGTAASTPSTTILSKSKGTGAFVRRGTHVDAPADAKFAAVEVQVWGTGAAWLDNLNFETGSGLWSNNVLINAGFDYDQDQTGQADGWYPYVQDPGTNVQIDFSQKHTGAASLKLKGVSNQDIYAGQSVGISGDGSTQIALSGWAMGQGLNTTGTFAMQVYMKDTYGNTTESFQINFDRTKSGWQNLSTVIQATKPFAYIKVYADLQNQSGTAWFDDFKVYKMNPTSSTVSAYNHAENGSFEQGTTAPDRWSSVGTATFKWEPFGNTFTGNRAISIANPSSSASWTSAVAIPYTSDQIATAVAYVKTDSVPNVKDPQTGKDQTGAQVFVNLLNGSGAWVGTVASPVITGSTEWRSIQVVLTTESVKSAIGNVDPSTVRKAQVGVKYLNSTGLSKSGTVYFDNVRLLTGNQQTTYEYDSLNNYVTKITTPVGDQVTNNIDQKTGRLNSTTNAKGQTTSFEYDTLGRLVKTTYPTNESGATDSFRYEYDLNGNLTTVKSGGEPVQQWSYDYSQLNLLTQADEFVTDAAGTTSTNTTWMNYDGLGRLVRSRTPENRFTQYAYDKAGRVTSVSHGIGDVISYTYQFQYDAGGRLIKMSDKVSNWAQYTYDKLNRLTDVTDTDDGKLKYDYNEKGQLTTTTVTTPNAVNSWSMSYKYDARGMVSTVTDNGHGKSNWYLYDEAGRLKKVADQSGISTYYQYDLAGRLTSLQTHDASGTLTDSFTYVYDKNGNVTTINDLLNKKSVVYEYDVRDQLIKESEMTGTTVTKSIKYTYDSLANRTSKTETVGTTDTVTTYGYSKEGNRLTEIGNTVVTYDKAGNMLSDGTSTYTWNSAGQLYQVTKGGVTYTYEYDAQGRRVQMVSKVGGATQKTENYHYDGDRIAYVTDANGLVLMRFTYDGQGRPLYLGVNGTVYTYQYNAHGDVVKLTDANGGLAVAYKYDAFGNVTTLSDFTGGGVGTLNPYRYAGYWSDQDTGLYYLKSRYYRADLGRFVSRDRLHGSTLAPSSMNQYVYGVNNPARFIDPSGYFVEDITDAATRVRDTVVDSVRDWLFELQLRVLLMTSIAVPTALIALEPVTARAPGLGPGFEMAGVRRVPTTTLKYIWFLGMTLLYDGPSEVPKQAVSGIGDTLPSGAKQVFGHVVDEIFEPKPTAPEYGDPWKAQEKYRWLHNNME